MARDSKNRGRDNGSIAPLSTSKLRSPRGILTDIRSGISGDDITAARRELWVKFACDES
jgi:hypothetical protein